MIRKCLVLAACVIPIVGIAAEPSLSEVMARLEMLQKQVQAQQVVIDQLRGQVAAQGGTTAVNEDVSVLVKQEVDAALEKRAQETESPVLKMASHIDNVTLKGDLRLRYEYRDSDDQDKDSRDRMRTRLRLGAVWKDDSENWEVGAGVTTGGENATSTNDTWSDNSFFETGDLRLDYAYAKHTLTLGNTNLAFIAGQQKNPFVTSWLLWDSDIRPAGFTVTADACGFFGTAGWYDVYNAGNEICEMVGAQVGYGFKSEAVSGKVAAAYYGYDDSVWKDSDMNGDGLSDYGDNDFTFQIGDLYAEVGMPLGKKASVSVFGDYFKNFGAAGGAGQGFQMDPALDAESEDDGWIAGVSLKAGKFSLSYAYAALSENAANPYLVDATVGIGLNYTDLEAHRIVAGYKLTKNCSISLLAQFAEAMKRDDIGGVDEYELDLNYRF